MKPIDKMAEFIYNMSEDICSICAYRKSCNAEMEKAWKGHERDVDFEPPMPKTESCIDGIIKFFEKNCE